MGCLIHLEVKAMLRVMLAVVLLPGCYFVEYFEDTKATASDPTQTLARDTVLGQFLGQPAGTVNEAALDTVHAVTTTVPPANIRPDPDLYARRLLLQHRPEGTVVARLIGSIEAFRPLVGGASIDFQKSPQKIFDATSLLATFSVSQVVCEGLVAPVPWTHGDWTSALPAAPSDWNANIRWLIQTVTGRHVNRITEDMVTQLRAIMDAEHNARAAQEDAVVAGQYDHASYVPVCSVLTIDPEAQNL